MPAEIERLQVVEAPAAAALYVHADDDSPCPAPALCARPHIRAKARPRPHAGMPDGWRDVPMPERVAALPRTRSGIPITYTVAWSSESTTVIQPDPDLERIYGRRVTAIFSSGAPGEGEPKLSVVDTARARRATLRGLCQICGQHLPGRPSPPWHSEPRWVGWFTKGQSMRVGGRNVPLIIDGWTCLVCLRYSLRVCPALVARQGAGDLVLLRIRRAELVATMERPESIPPDELDEIPVGMMKIAPTDFDIVAPEDLLTA